MAKTGKPRGRPRKNPVTAAQIVDAAYAEIGVSPVVDAMQQDIHTLSETLEPEGQQYPADWHPGMLLNVRNTGPDYTITLWPEEYDYRKPGRALKFTNPGECQNFVSRWYMRESHDPRAR